MVTIVEATSAVFRLMLLGAAFGPVSLGHESLHRGPEDVMKLQSEPKNPQRST